jgi:hypothetical protein
MSTRKYGPDGVRPSGRVLVHNHVVPWGNGFRTWYDYLDAPRRFRRIMEPGDPPVEYVQCKCDWRPGLGVHYRVKGMGNTNLEQR